MSSKMWDEIIYPFPNFNGWPDGPVLVSVEARSQADPVHPAMHLATNQLSSTMEPIHAHMLLFDNNTAKT